MFEMHEFMLLFRIIGVVFLFMFKWAIATRAWLLAVLPLAAMPLAHLGVSEDMLEILYVALYLLASVYVVWCHIRWVIRKLTKNEKWTLLHPRRGKAEARDRGDLSKPQGFTFGKAGGKWVCRTEGDSDHVLVLGAPGTGKSQALALPSLAVWQGGELVVDVKGELWEQVGSKRDRAVRFSVTDEAAYGFDPFEPLGRNADPHDVCVQIAHQLIPENPNEKDPFWTQAARNMLSACLLAGVKGKMGFLDCMDAATTSGARGLVEWVATVGDLQADTYNAMFLDMDDKQLSSVYATMHSRVAFFAVDEDVRGCLKRPDRITPAALEEGASIYLCVEEAKLEQYKALTALIVAQFMRHFEQMRNDAKAKTLFLLDECPRLGKLDALGNALATLRSKGVCVCVIGQSLAQFQTIYSREEAAAMVDMCGKIAVLSAKGETAAMLTRLVGDNLERMMNRGDSSQVLNPIQMGRNKGYSEQYQPIIRESEWATLGDELILVDSSPKAKRAYIRVKKMPFWKYGEKYLVKNG